MITDSYILGQNITESTVYWITRMDYLQRGTLTIGIMLFVIAVLWLVVASCARANAHKDDKPELNKHLIIAAIAACLFLSLGIGGLFIPNTKEMCAIKIIPIVANNEETQELPNKVMELVNEWIEELKPVKHEN